MLRDLRHEKLPLQTERFVGSTTHMRGHTSCPAKAGEDMVLLEGIVERNSLSGNWIASLDREVIKKSGYNGEAYVLIHNG